MPRALKTHSNNQSNAKKTIEVDWSFSKLKRKETLWGPHGYHRYPAKFIPQLVRQLIEDYSTIDSFIGDPFVGSATTGIEALRTGRRFWGADINPVARLISQAKCAPIDPQLLNLSWKKLEKQLERLHRIGRRKLTQRDKKTILSIDIARAGSKERLVYWFPKAHSAILEKVLRPIRAMRNKDIRAFYLCAFSNILRSCSIWLSGSTKPQKDLDKILSDPVDAFRRQARDMIKRNKLYWDDLDRVNISPSEIAERFSIDLQDARSLPLNRGQLDLIVTSPPYATCYQYLELHQLTQLWFEKFGILGPVDLRHACIGGNKFSNRKETKNVISTGSSSADRALLKLTQKAKAEIASAVEQEIRALRYYFRDMKDVITELARVLGIGKHLVLIVGDSIKRGIKIPTSDALHEIATSSGFELERKIVRKVPVRVLVSTRDKKTGRFSSTQDSDTQVYPEEDILIFKRIPTQGQ